MYVVPARRVVLYNARHIFKRSEYNLKGVDAIPFKLGPFAQLNFKSSVISEELFKVVHLASNSMLLIGTSLYLFISSSIRIFGKYMTIQHIHKKKRRNRTIK
ncbi:hypothetical protein AYI70_g10150 [Smittium culicis]|uniref:Uncharacterized protein n=1 Tax=Smittium culicis TaxID=133412 RepID=A0A1R1X802_9FUNG|nr:hypothetical protein AYI70_g10150 [Smittium culicis]